LTDPLAQIVQLLQPDLSYCKLVEASGSWRVRRAEQGKPFFCALLDGAVRLEIDGRPPRLVQQGDFILVPAATDFTSSSALAPPRAAPLNMPVEVGPGRFRLGDPAAPPDVRMLIGYCTFGSGDAALLVSLLPALIQVRGEDRLATLIQLAVQEFRDRRPARNVILARLMEVVFIEALRAPGADGHRGILKGLGDARVAAAIGRMHDDPAEPWTVADLAREAAMSRSAFFTRFRQAVGMAPMAYLLHWRMVLAKDLLRTRDLSVAAIARQVGYGSASAFSVAFTRHVGAPPSLFARAEAEAA